MTLVIQYSIDALTLASLYALLALGIALIFGVMNLINFAHGELVMVTGYALLLISLSPWIAVALGAVGCAVVVAILMERFAFRPFRGASAGTLLVTSFAVSYILQNVAVLVEGERPKAVPLPEVFIESLTVGDYSISKLDLITIVVTVVLLVALAVFLDKNPLGIQMRAAAEDFEMARLLGVKANRVIGLAFALSGLLAGVAGLLLVAKTGSVSPRIGTAPLVVAFVATVLGGLGSLWGAAAGGALLGLLSVALQAGLPVEMRPFRDALVYAVVFAVLVARPEGLIPARARRTRV